MKRILGVALGLVLAFWAGRASAAYTSIPWVTEGFGYVPTDASGLIELTNDSASIDGVAWNPCAISMNSNWDLQFVFNFGANVEECGGDGMAFILQAASNNGNSPATIAAPTSGGSDSGEKAYTGIPDSLAIAFNTYPHPYMPNQNSSINVLANGDGEATYSDVAGCGAGNTVTGPCFPSMSGTEPNVQDGADHTVEIAWNAAALTLTVIFDGSQRGVWALPAGYAAAIFNGDSNVIYGVGASSGGATDFQQFAQTNADPNLCEATPTVIATATLIALPANNCGNTPAPTFTPEGPTDTPTITPTPYPTPCGGKPAFVQSAVVNSGAGCLGSGNPTSWSVTIPALGGELLLVQIETDGGAALTGATWGGTAMTALPSDSDVTFSGGEIYSYYLVSPATGAQTLALDTTGGCSWNVVASVYSNVDTSSPFGTITAKTGTTEDFADNITTAYGYSIIDDFIEYPNGTFTFTGMTGTQLFASSTTNSNNAVYGSYLLTGAPGAYSLTYDQNTGSTGWTGVTAELRAPSSCATPSDTPSMTWTPSPTRTPTATSTGTFTASSTRTATASPTDTFTVTATPTVTVTSVWTVTATPTRSVTASSTPSATSTATQTATVTASPTKTATVSPTDTFTMTLTPTQPPTPPPTFTRTDTPTATPPATPTPTFTDSPADTSTATPTATPTATDSPTSTSTSTRTVTLSSTSTTTPSPTLSFSSTASPTLSVTPTSTSSFSPTVTFTVTQTYTITETPVPEPYTVTVGIYNSAGELVRTLYSGSSEYPANQAQVQQAAEGNGQQVVDVTGLDGGAGNTLVWYENNNAGQAVQSGIYEVQISSVNTFGQVTTQAAAVSVVSTQGAVSLDVYNSAGELVANLSAQLAGLTSTVTGINLDAPALIPSTTPVAGSVPPIKVSLADGATVSVIWNGLNSQGGPLQPGNYLVTLSSDVAGGNQILETKTIVILDTLGGAGSPQAMVSSARVAPNPVDQGWFEVRYQPGGTDTAVGVLYTLTGERVSEASDNGGGTLRLNGNWPSGVYLLDFEIHNGSAGVLAGRILKVAVIR